MNLTIPNQLTILRVLLTPVFAFYYLSDRPNAIAIGTVIFVVAAFTDWYDGYIARRYGVITRFGQFADPLADKVLVLTALMIFAVRKVIPLWMVLLITARDIFITVLRLYAIHKGKAIVTHMVAKWKTFFQMLLIFLILIFLNLVEKGQLSPVVQAYVLSVFYYTMLGIVLMTIYSLIVYFRENSQLIGSFFKSMLPKL